MQIVLKNVRLAFSQFLFTAGNGPQDKPETPPAYTSKFLIEKNDPQLKKLDSVMMEVAKGKWKSKAAAIVKGIKAQDKLCIHDGDMKLEWAGFEGMDYINSKARLSEKPQVVGRDKSVKLKEEDGIVYSGCYVNVILDIWAQDSHGSKRINACLKAVQFVKDGDAFTGSAPANLDDLDDLSVDDDIDTEEALC